MDGGDQRGPAGWLVGSGLVVAALTSVVAAACRAAGDAASVAFVVTGYAALLLLLLLCLRAFERAPPGEARRREQLRRAVWLLSTLLTALFAWKVAGVIQAPAAALLVWAMAAATTVGGFVALFRRA